MCCNTTYHNHENANLLRIQHIFFKISDKVTASLYCFIKDVHKIKRLRSYQKIFKLQSCTNTWKFPHKNRFGKSRNIKLVVVKNYYNKLLNSTVFYRIKASCCEVIGGARLRHIRQSQDWWQWWLRYGDWLLSKREREREYYLIISL